MHERHGGTANGQRSRLYVIWAGMRARCNNPNHHAFRYYGARGIKVCPDWDDSFGVFKRWAESTGYRADKTIDRLDNGKGYCPENCRWATDKMQARNKLHAVNANVVTHDGREVTLAELSRLTRITYTTLVKRFHQGLRGEDLTRRPRAEMIRVQSAVEATANGAAKLTQEQVAEIRASTESGVALARRYRVAQSTVSMIRSGTRR